MLSVLSLPHLKFLAHAIHVFLHVVDDFACVSVRDLVAMGTDREDSRFDTKSESSRVAQ